MFLVKIRCGKIDSYYNVESFYTIINNIISQVIFLITFNKLLVILLLKAYPPALKFLGDQSIRKTP